MKKRILKMFVEKGILIDPDAVELLSQSPNALRCANAILYDTENRPLVLTREDVRNYLELQPKTSVAKMTPKRKREETALGTVTGSAGEIRILKDITGDSTCVGNVIDFAKLFNDRFATLEKILSKRRELAGLVSIAKAKRVQRDVRFIGIINDTYTTKNGHTMLEVEDREDKVQVLIMKGARRSADYFIKDEVIGIIGSFSKDGEIVIAKEVIRPEVPVNNAMEGNGSESILAFVSDTHVGSTEFLQDAWNNLVSWLNKDPVARDVRYIIMPGDLVDGIGIYPGQEDELLIEDVYAQYSELSRLVRMIPQRIKVVMMPGNHDAVRLAEPQPALSSDITSMFDTHITFVGNPCYMEIEGRTILAYHGRSMDDLKASIPALSYTDPCGIMKEMLRRRHVAPIYGERTALAPEQKDYLLIDRVPNIFVTGHVHSCAVTEYRGIKLINASAWQSQTSYQRMHNQVPDPGKVPMVNLGTGETWIEDFSG